VLYGCVALIISALPTGDLAMDCSAAFVVPAHVHSGVQCCLASRDAALRCAVLWFVSFSVAVL
jgi:hypothetical protein